jgi:UDP-N-acetylglucosamine:LPS N-acetylglucosamine transferase
MLAPALQSILRRHCPDAVVTTYPLYHPGLSQLLAARRVPLITVVTDLGSVHPLWFSRPAEACLVATQTVRQQAIACGLPPDRVHITGVPVDPRLAGAHRPAAASREELGWRPDRPVLLAVGGRRVLGFVESVRAVDRSGAPLQLAIVAGGDDELYARLGRADWSLPAHVYNWVDDLPRLMRAADGLLCKAGGLIVSEALACGLPLLLVDRLPDQEMGNAEFVMQSGAGELALNPDAAASAVWRWFGQGGQVLAQRTQKARAVGRPRAAYDAAEHVWQAAQRTL